MDGVVLRAKDFARVEESAAKVPTIDWVKPRRVIDFISLLLRAGQEDRHRYIRSPESSRRRFCAQHYGLQRKDVNRKARDGADALASPKALPPTSGRRDRLAASD